MAHWRVLSVDRRREVVDKQRAMSGGKYLDVVEEGKEERLLTPRVVLV